MFNHKEIIMCWIPSHIGVRGNERADSAAKSALDLKPNNINIPYTDLKPKINKLFSTKWQQCWNNSINNKIFQINPTLGKWKPASIISRKEQVILSRIRTGHTTLTHSFMLKQEQQPQCMTCQTPCTVKHILAECGALAIARNQYLKNNNMKDIFENIHMDGILSFLRETGLYLKIWYLASFLMYCKNQTNKNWPTKELVGYMVLLSISLILILNILNLSGVKWPKKCWYAVKQNYLLNSFPKFFF